MAFGKHKYACTALGLALIAVAVFGIVFRWLGPLGMVSWATILLVGHICLAWDSLLFASIREYVRRVVRRPPNTRDE